MSPRHALRELEKALPSNAMVSTDIGNICSVSNSYLRFDKPASQFAAMSYGNCGYAFPAAMGKQTFFLKIAVLFDFRASVVFWVSALK